MFYILGNFERQNLGLWKAKQKRYNADTDADVNADANAEISKWPIRKLSSQINLLSIENKLTCYKNPKNFQWPGTNWSTRKVLKSQVY